MKSFALFILAFLATAGLMLAFYAKDIGKAQVDFQAYSQPAKLQIEEMK